MKIENWLKKWTGMETGPNGTQDLCRKILELERNAGDRPLVYKRSNAGFAFGSPIGGKGWPDFDIVRDGRYVALECKGLTKDGKKTDLNDNQVRILMQLSEVGASIWIVHDPAQLDSALHNEDFARKLHVQSVEHVRELARKLNATQMPISGENEE